MRDFSLTFLAGLLTVLSPCVLPALPLVVGSALQAHRLGPIAVALGMTVSFAIVGVSIAAAGSVIGLDQHSIRILSGILLVLAGVVLISSKLQSIFANLLTPLANRADRALRSANISGLLGQFFVGALLGAVWSPCSGPSLGAAAGLAAQYALVKAGILMIVFGLGASLPLLAIAYGARSFFLSKRDLMLSSGGKVKKLFGLVLILIGVLIGAGIDKSIEAFIVSVSPDWLIDLTSSF